MAKADVSVYNTYILITRPIIKTATGLVLALLYILLCVGSVGAQASLQSGSGGLQPQTGQAQDSLNTQNETGSVQTNNGSAVLNQNGSRPLGVVSSPNQTVPDAVAIPSPTLKAGSSATPKDSSNTKWLLLAAGLFIIALAGAYRLLLEPIVKTQEEPVPAATPIIRPEPAKPVSKAAKKRKAGKPKKKRKR